MKSSVGRHCGFWSKHLQLIVYGKQFVENVGGLVGSGIEGVCSRIAHLGIVDEGHDTAVVKTVGGNVVIAYHSIGTDETGNLLFMLIVGPIVNVVGVDEVIEDREDVRAVGGDNEICDCGL